MGRVPAVFAVFEIISGFYANKLYINELVKNDGAITAGTFRSLILSAIIGLPLIALTHPLTIACLKRSRSQK